MDTTKTTPPPELNAAKFKALVKQHGKTRHYLNHVLWKRYAALQRAYALAFDVDTKLVHFKQVADLNHYRGGYPQPMTPPKLDSFAALIAEAFAVFQRLDGAARNRLVEKLAEHQLVLAPSTTYRLPALGVVFTGKRQQKFDAAWATAFGKLAVPQDPGAFVTQCVEEADHLQSEICRLADTIKLGGAKRALKDHQVTKGNFKIAVKTEAQRIKKEKKKDAVVARVKEDRVDNLVRALKAFEE